MLNAHSVDVAYDMESNIHDRNVMPARMVVDKATMGGARAFPSEDQIGSLEMAE